MSDLTDRITGVESGNRVSARNPRSSAAGVGQFIDSTWLRTIRKHRPDLDDMDDGSVLALRTDPKVGAKIGREMTAALAGENQAGLVAAGHKPTRGNTYLAHFAGLGGARQVLESSPTTPVSRLLSPAAIKANPFLANMTAADLTAWADAKMAGRKAPGGSLVAQPESTTGGASTRDFLRQLFGAPDDASALAALDKTIIDVADSAGLTSDKAGVDALASLFKAA